MVETSKTEINDLLKAWFVISLVFTIAMGNFSPAIFVIAALTVGIGFLLHELSHKFVAQHFGAVAEFRADYQMLWVALILSFFGFIFAAPGAVIIATRVNKRENGIIAASGSLTNLILALIFSLLTPIIPVARYGFSINSWLALFNMLPFLNLDGLKVMEWNKFVWFAIISTAAVFTFLL